MRDDRKVPLVTTQRKDIYMASKTKHTDAAVSGALMHNTREMPHPPSNQEIDPERSHLNYHLDSHGETAREAKDYYNSRLKELYHYNRADVKTCVQWVCTAPTDLPVEQEEVFFKATYDYLNSIYGEENCIQCVVHYDEGVRIGSLSSNAEELRVGRPHLHYMAIPVVKNDKYGVPNRHGNLTKMSRFEEKVCCDEKVTLHSLQVFHPDYQKWIDKAGINATVYKGGQGINLGVDQLKAVTKETGIIVSDLLSDRDKLQAKVTELEKQIETSRTNRWGKSTGWGQDKKEEISWNK